MWYVLHTKLKIMHVLFCVKWRSDEKKASVSIVHSWTSFWLRGIKVWAIYHFIFYQLQLIWTVYALAMTTKNTRTHIHARSLYVQCTCDKMTIVWCENWSVFFVIVAFVALVHNFIALDYISLHIGIIFACKTC